MNMDYQGMVEEAIRCNAARAAVLETEKVVFSEYLRSLCAQNACGKYGTNWVCPPAVGPVEQLKAAVKQYGQGLVFQTVYKLEDSFDIEGMNNAKKVHDQVFYRILDSMKQKFQCRDMLPLNAGACELCPKCTYKDKKECRFPDKAISSVEAYGINVTALVKSCGIPYHNGQNTVSYVGYILFNEA